MKIHPLLTTILSIQLTLLTTTSNAQGLYFADFENISGNQYTLNTYNINGLQWESLEGLIGATASDLKSGNKSLRLRRNSSTFGYFKTTQNYTDGLGSISFLYARSNFANDRTGISPKLEIAYSTDDGLNWTAIDTIDFDGINSLQLYQSSFLNITTPVQLKLEIVSGDIGKRINIDDITIKNAYTNIAIQSFSPQGYGVSAGNNSLQITFSEAISLGDFGKIFLNEINGATQSFDVSSSNISIINDSVALIDNILLTPDKNYFVLFDSTFFKSTSLGLLSTGVYDSTTWQFATYIQTVKTFYDKFENCDDGRKCNFISESIKGDARWECDLYFWQNDPPFAHIIGGTHLTSSENEDFLIYQMPVLIKDEDILVDKIWFSFDEKRRYEGDSVIRGVYFSTDYAGNAAAATWQKIKENWNNIEEENQWQQAIWNITDIIPKNIPFYIAFKYESKTTANATAYEWCIDNVRLFTDTATLANVEYKGLDNLSLTVLGKPNTEKIDLLIQNRNADNYHLEIYDLQGKKIYKNQQYFRSGKNHFSLPPIGLQKGMYLLRVYNQHNIVSSKVVVAE